MILRGDHGECSMAEIAEGAGAPGSSRGNAASLRQETWGADAKFYLTMSVVAATILFLGFAPSFYLKSVIQAPTPPLFALTIVHGVVFTAWMALFITQSALIVAKRPAPHRQLG